MTPKKVRHFSVDERQEIGREARKAVPPSSHEGWVPAAHRPDPVALLEEQDKTREADLVPVRHGRMRVSPFTFYRGTAKIMAADFEGTPRSGLEVQLCGDAHLSNFGLFASPERTLLFDLNDFDETLPGPFEYDVMRMAASFTIAARNNGFTAAQARSVTTTAIAAYRTAMADFAGLHTLEVWYSRLAEKELMKGIARAATAAALLTDYVLTVAVSISAGIFAVTSFVPSLGAHKVGLSLACLLVIVVANLFPTLTTSLASYNTSEHTFGPVLVILVPILIGVAILLGVVRDLIGKGKHGT